ncbi:sporulation protein [Streptomyces avidinii]|uniref:sporulation protein n=1 Tax=Streptomyces avidinii TaxID=1895 RepID=UPI00386534F5|nr:sporulation protein [Streptomyces avidinii]
MHIDRDGVLGELYPVRHDPVDVRPRQPPEPLFVTHEHHDEERWLLWCRRAASDDGLLDVIAKAYSYNGSLNDDEITGLSAKRHNLQLAPGEEVAVAFSGRLPWECPVTELHGHALGVDLSLTTRLAYESASPVRDLDFLHIAAPPLYAGPGRLRPGGPLR